MSQNENRRVFICILLREDRRYCHHRRSSHQFGEFRKTSWLLETGLGMVICLHEIPHMQDTLYNSHELEIYSRKGLRAMSFFYLDVSH